MKEIISWSPILTPNTPKRRLETSTNHCQCDLSMKPYTFLLNLTDSKKTPATVQGKSSTLCKYPLTQWQPTLIIFIPGKLKHRVVVLPLQKTYRSYMEIMRQTQWAVYMKTKIDFHTLFRDVVLSLIMKGRLLLKPIWEPFLFRTAINADFQGELWFLNPLLRKQILKNILLTI